jgi:hypothetical protein
MYKHNTTKLVVVCLKTICFLVLKKRSRIDARYFINSDGTCERLSGVSFPLSRPMGTREAADESRSVRHTRSVRPQDLLHAEVCPSNPSAIPGGFGSERV